VSCVRLRATTPYRAGDQREHRLSRGRGHFGSSPAQVLMRLMRPMELVCWTPRQLSALTLSIMARATSTPLVLMSADPGSEDLRPP
jgi:hypothetical protein